MRHGAQVHVWEARHSLSQVRVGPCFCATSVRLSSNQPIISPFQSPHHSGVAVTRPVRLSPQEEPAQPTREPISGTPLNPSYRHECSVLAGNTGYATFGRVRSPAMSEAGWRIPSVNKEDPSGSGESGGHSLFGHLGDFSDLGHSRLQPTLRRQ